MPDLDYRVPYRLQGYIIPLTPPCPALKKGPITSQQYESIQIYKNIQRQILTLVKITLAIIQCPQIVPHS